MIPSIATRIRSSSSSFFLIVNKKLTTMAQPLASASVSTSSSAAATVSSSLALPVSSHWDLVVIGGGSGGLAAAKEAAKVHQGKKVLALDHVSPSPRGTKWGLGGTCVNVGCIPKKLMHHAGNIGASMHKDAEQFGWSNAAGATHSWGTMQQLITDYIKSLNFAYGVGLRGAGVTYVEGKATFTAPDQLIYTTNSGKTTKISFDRAIIAVGGRPTPLNIPGHELTISSDDIFWSQTPPGKTLLIGAGYIALEIASFLHHLGFDTSVMVRGRVLRKMDWQSGEQVAELMERDGVRFLMGANPVSLKSKGNRPQLLATSVQHPTDPRYQSIEPDAKGNARWIDLDTGIVQTVHKKPAGLITYASFTPNAPIEVAYTDAQGKVQYEIFDTVLVATGRTANVHQLGLPAANVSVVTDKVLVDAAEQTTNPRIFAVGDVAAGVLAHGSKQEPVDRPELTPVAIQAGQLLARRLWSNLPTRAAELMQYHNIASTVFTSPSEYAFIGLSEEQARAPRELGGIGAENVEVYWSRFGSLEISPLHPVMPKQRSTHFTQRNQWSVRYSLERNLTWPEHDFDPNELSSHVIYRAAIDSVGEPALVLSKDVQASHGTPATYTIRLRDGAKGAPEITGVKPQQLCLQESAASENDELFYKANCLAKLIVDRSRGELVVGLHFIGPNAGEVVQGFALGLSLGATKQHFDALVGIHPTVAEEFTVLTVTQSEGKTLLKQAGCGGGSCG